MRKYCYLLLLLCGLFSSHRTFAQAEERSVGDTDVFLPGQYLELGVNNAGAFGAGPVPSGYHPYDADGGGSGALAEIYDVGHDGWTVGTPGFMGDYTYPGSPFEGWEVQLNGSDRTQGFTTGTTSTLSSTGSITPLTTGHSGLYVNSGGILSTTWTGSGGTSGLAMRQTTTMDSNGSQAIITVVLKNTGASTSIPNVYYLRSCDPDNDVTRSGDYATNNTIVHQNELPDHPVEVDAEGQHYYNHWSLCTRDCRAKAFIYESWPLSISDNLATIWSSASVSGGSTFTQGNTLDGDYAIGLVFNLGSIGPGDSVLLTYAYVFNDSFSDIGTAFPVPQLVVNGVATPIDSSRDNYVVDTFATCSVPDMSSLPLSILNANIGEFAGSTWTWSPATALAATTGTSNTVNVLELAVPITYTISGTGLPGDCETDTFLLTVIPCFNAFNNGPICQGDTLKLSCTPDTTSADTYDWYLRGTLFSTAQNPVVPNVPLTDSGLYMVVKTIGSSGITDTAYTDVVIKPLPVVTAGSNSPVCTGAALSLTATPDSTGETFSWAGPLGFTSGAEDTSLINTVTAMSGTYTVYTAYNGCFDSGVVTVSVDSTPQVPSAASNSPVSAPLCSGNTLSLAASDGTAGVSYYWTGPLGFVSGSENPNITDASALTSGVYTVVASLGICADSTTTTVLINPTPPVPTLRSNAPVCTGAALDLISTDTTGATVTWLGPDGFTSTLADPVISPVSTAAAGVYSAYATLASCISDTAVITVAIDSTPLTPTAGSNSPVCSGTGDTIYLTSSDGTEGVGFSWTGPDGFTSTAQNPFITPATTVASGTYTVSAGLGSCVVSATTVVTVIPTPPENVVTANAPICSGGLLLLKDSLQSYAYPATYTWTGPNGFTSTSRTPTISGIITADQGFYSVVATYEGCSNQLSSIGVAVDSTPATPVVPSAITVCQGDTIYLTTTEATAGVTYQWSSPSGFSSTLESPVLYSVDTFGGSIYEYPFTLVVTPSSSTCTVSATVDVTINPIPTLLSVSANPNPVCSGATLSLQSTFTYLFDSYNWSGPNGFISNVQNPEITGISTLGTGTYTVSASRYGCNSPLYSIFVAVDSTPALPYISSNSPVCLNDSLYLYSADSTPGITYLWNGPNSFSSTLQNPFITNIPLAGAGIYTLAVTLTTGAVSCSDSLQTLVSVTVPPAFTPTSNSPVCSGDTLKLYANDSAGSTYVWAGPYPYAFATYRFASDPIIPNVTVESSGIYTVTALYEGCLAVEEDTVLIKTTPTVPSVSWLSFCQYYPAGLIMADDTALTWYSADTISTADQYPGTPTINTSVLGSSWYYLTQTVDGCQSSIDSIQITVYPSPTVTVTPADTSLCPHSSYVITAIDASATDSYHWYPSMYLSDSNTASVTVNPETSVTYTVVASNTYGCADTATSSVIVYPSAVITLGPDVTLYPGESYTMSPSTNCTSFSWFPPAGLSNSTIPDPVASPSLSTRYIVSGSTEYGCSTTDSININVTAESLLALPNAFTPGSAANAEFKIIKQGEASLTYFRIFNRWGQKVFETNNMDQGWDGTFNGTPQPFDVYVYEIDAVASNGQHFIMHGNVTLVR